MKKTVSMTLGVAILLVAGWLGASFYSARVSGNYVTSLPEMYKQHNFIHIKTIEHKQSAFSSAGQFEVRFPNEFVKTETGMGAIGLIVNYSISNLLMPASAGRIAWQLSGDRAEKSLFTQWFGQGSVMQGQGVIQYDGKRQSSIELAELLIKSDGAAVQLTPVSGNLVWDNQTLNMQLKSDQLNIRSEGHAIDWRGISFDVALSDRMQGIGNYSMGIEKGSNDSSIFEGMKLNKKVSVSDARLNVLLNQTIKSYTFNLFKLKYVLSDVEQSFSLTNLDLLSVQKMSEIMRDAKDFQNLTAQERGQMTQSLRRLLDQGFSMEVPKINAKAEGGSIDGKLKIDVLKSDSPAGTAFSTAQRLRASGALVLNGKVIDKAQRSTALLLGIAVGTPEGIKAAFDFASGVVKVNGKTFNVKEYLTYADDVINEAITP